MAELSLRFCNRCTRLHDVSCFDGANKYCKKSLAKIYAKRKCSADDGREWKLFLKSDAVRSHIYDKGCIYHSQDMSKATIKISDRAEWHNHSSYVLLATNSQGMFVSVIINNCAFISVVFQV